MPTATKYCFTYFKFPEKIKDWFTSLSQLENFRYVVGQIEVSPTTNRHHIQGYIEFAKKTPLRLIRKLMPGIHVEIKSANSTREQARDYCKKSETRLEGTEPIELGIWHINHQGKRSDINKVKDCLRTKEPLPFVILNHCSNYQSIRIAEKLYQYSSVPRDINTPPKVEWYYGNTGTGKTKSVYDQYNQIDIYPSFSFKWWNGYHQQKVILIDDMRGDYCKFHQLLKLLDRYPLLVENKGGTIHINSPHIIITSAYHPKYIYNTREDVNQLLRRIHVLKCFDDEPSTADSSLFNFEM